ncbi:MAG: RsmD family RNA methyltransferase [Acidobacteria bacterium]|nr:RsmD family RNA methyltransferase [Acidobacteriota bacterium]
MQAPSDDRIRPTPDRVREAMFNTLYSLSGRDDGWSVENATVLDLFSGTGALGIEALSRGARSVGFIESDRSALELIEQNLAQLGADEKIATVISIDVLQYLKSVERPGADLVFADPPYGYDLWAELMDALPADRLVAESSGELDEPTGWRSIASRSYGTSVLTFFESTRIQGKEDR